MKPRIHTLPINDLIEHEEVGTGCPCGPTVEEYEQGVLVIHNSLDGRELVYG